MSLVLTSNFMQNLQTQQNNNHIIIPSTTEYHLEMQFQILKLLKNLKEEDSEDGLHERDGGILGIVSYLSSFQVNHNVITRSTLKRKRVNAHVGSIPIILMEEKANINDLDLAKYELMNKFAWISGRFSTVDQIGSLSPFPFGVSNVRIAEEDFWGREIIINYSVIIKIYTEMKKEDMERVKLFYDTTKGTQYLEKAVKYVVKVKDDESEVLTLYLTPVKYSSKSNMLRIFDPVTVDSYKPATDIYMLIKMMEDTENMWHGNPYGQDFFKELKNCYQQNSLSSILNHSFIKPQ
ncbi:2188_t:CDS:2 [Funneliformis caledonium]|uniref:2188_t:CDS:1 n=1 Tax=Funneliformis caledonium TaxID=1117310 RepID=A0A9N9HE58_9GLOM|nr:2188_t:CDS:2 [Funneliformis caledonium]